MRKLLRGLKEFWRAIRWRCVLCGRPTDNHGEDCCHCNSNKLRCHMCNKRLNFWKLYGGGL